MLDLIAEDARIDWQSGKKEFDGDFAKGPFLGESCLLLKPMGFYNRAGRSVGALMRFYKLDESDLIVLHDDIDVPQGKVKLKVGGGHGGNNGVRSIIEDAGLRDFQRIKLGVGRPPENWAGRDWVLSPLSDDELLAMQKELLDEVKIRIEGIFKKSAAS